MARITLSFILLSASRSLAASSADTSKVLQAKISNYSDDTSMYAGTTFTVALQVDDPFVFYNNRSKGNARFSGITIDVLKLIGLKLQCDFVFELANPVEIESQDAPLRLLADIRRSEIDTGRILVLVQSRLQRMGVCKYTLPNHTMIPGLCLL